MASHRIAGAIIAGFVLGLSQIAVAQAGGFRVLFTSFDPFGGNAANNTQAIAADLAASPEMLGPDVSVELCNLPVVYDAAAAKAMSCVAADQPDAVISLGEAACELRIETAATNLDDTPGYPDNAGQSPVGSVIVPGGPRRSGFNFPVQALFCALDSSSPSVEVSTSPGGFVCNNTAYHLSQELGAKRIPFTFIHVPNAECSADQKNAAINAAAIAKMVRAAVASLRAHSDLADHMPTTIQQARTLQSKLQRNGAPACEQQFAREIVSGYKFGN